MKTSFVRMEKGKTMKIVARPWTPQDLLDDLQGIIDEESDNYLNTRRTTLCMAKAFLSEHFAEQRWIPVAERLPEQGQNVIVFSGGNLQPEVFAYHFWSEEYNSWKGVTHWMPLPNPPKGE